jgi:hypothetical protein
MSKNIKTIETPTQAERFIETARALGTDEDEAAFREKLRAIAWRKPKDDPSKAPKK